MGSKFMAWIDDRFPATQLWKEHISEYYAPKNFNFWYFFGGLAVLMLGMQLITGIFLTMHFKPDAANAFASVEYIMRDVEWGWLIRYLHSTGASAFFVIIYLHMYRALLYGSYKGPRELLWILGMLLYVLLTAEAFFGYVLPYGQMSFWGATVITGLFGAIPFIGESIQTWLLGGPAVDNATLNRFFSLHYLLPFIISALVAVHIWAFHTTGNNNPTGVEVRRTSKAEAEKDTVPFWPYFVMKDLFALAIILIVFFAVVGFMPNYLGHPDNYIEANPLVTPAHIVPEWYFWPFYAILRAFTVDLSFFGLFTIVEAKLLGVIAMFASILILFFLPWLDNSPVRSGNYRPKFKIAFIILVLDVLVLGFCGQMPAEEPWVMLSQLAAAYYFAHFLIVLPLISHFEKPLPLPGSITEAVLNKHRIKGERDALPGMGSATQPQPAE